MQSKLSKKKLSKLNQRQNIGLTGHIVVMVCQKSSGEVSNVVKAGTEIT